MSPSGAYPTVHEGVAIDHFGSRDPNPDRPAEWIEIDRNAPLWAIPAAKIKSAREHRVPLSDSAQEILTNAETSKGPDGLDSLQCDGNRFPTTAWENIARSQYQNRSAWIQKQLLRLVRRN